MILPQAQMKQPNNVIMILTIIAEVKGNMASREMKDYFSDYVKSITKD